MINLDAWFSGHTDGAYSLSKGAELLRRGYSCRECNHSCDEPEQFIEHLQLHEPNATGNRRCPYCPWSSQRTAFLNHLLYHNRVPPGKFRCDECHFSSDNATSSTKHYNLHRCKKLQVTDAAKHEREKSEFSIASSQVNTADSPPLNEEDHDTEDTTDDINLKVMHTDKRSDVKKKRRKTQCPLCPHVIRGYSSVQMHLACHDRVPPGKFRCRKCNYSANALNHFNKHESLHNGSSPIKKKRGRGKGNAPVIKLKLNASDPIRVRAREKLGVKCQHCPWFHSSSVEKFHKHLELHDRVPPGRYPCRECSYSSDTAIDAMSHDNLHTFAALPEKASTLPSFHNVPNKTVSPTKSSLPGDQFCILPVTCRRVRPSSKRMPPNSVLPEQASTQPSFHNIPKKTVSPTKSSLPGDKFCILPVTCRRVRRSTKRMPSTEIATSFVKSAPASSNDTACPLVAKKPLTGDDNSVPTSLIKSEPASSNDTACPLLATRTMSGDDKAVTPSLIKVEANPDNEMLSPETNGQSVATSLIKSEPTSFDDSLFPETVAQSGPPSLIKSEAMPDDEMLCPGNNAQSNGSTAKFGTAASPRRGLELAINRNIRQHLLARNRCGPRLSFRCRECGYSTDSPAHHRDHVKKHFTIQAQQNGTRFKCRHCPMVVGFGPFFWWHLLAHDRLPQGKYRCSECTFSTDSPVSHGNHMKVHHTEARWSSKPGKTSTRKPADLRIVDSSGNRRTVRMVPLNRLRTTSTASDTPNGRDIANPRLSSNNNLSSKDIPIPIPTNSNGIVEAIKTEFLKTESDHETSSDVEIEAYANVKVIVEDLTPELMES